MSYSIIAAVGKNNELGYKNNLIWHLKKDLSFFRDTTMNKTIIMGRRTFESLPRMLPNRKHVVLSSSNDFPEEVTVFKSIDELLEYFKDSKEELFVIGGSSIYKQFLDISDKLYLTQIDASFEDADVYFPSFNKEDFDMEILDSECEDDINYEHVLYKRKK